VCFSEEYKLRTVLWQWRGRALTAQALEALRRLRAALDDGALAAELGEYLAPEEVHATVRRVEMLLKHRVHPYPSEEWPAVPWPPL
jgi:uncharacterized repeat protein (TIGR03843 family)